MLGLSLREWREQENVLPHISGTDSKGFYDHPHNETIGPSEDKRSAFDVATIREHLQRPRMLLRWVDGKAQVGDALPSFTVMVTCCEVCVVKRPRCLRSWLPDVKKRRNLEEYRESSRR